MGEAGEGGEGGMRGLYGRLGGGKSLNMNILSGRGSMLPWKSSCAAVGEQGLGPGWGPGWGLGPALNMNLLSGRGWGQGCGLGWGLGPSLVSSRALQCREWAWDRRARDVKT